MFNCPEWGISVDNITLYGTTNSTIIGSPLITITPANTSCDSLVRVCISKSVSTNESITTLAFQLSPAYAQVDKKIAIKKQIPEFHLPVNQLYSQVDKNKKKKTKFTLQLKEEPSMQTDQL